MSSQSIEEEAKEIMNNFFKAIKDIEIEEEPYNEITELREEDISKKETNEEFKQRFINNAPNARGDSILANKGNWGE